LAANSIRQLVIQTFAQQRQRSALFKTRWSEGAEISNLRFSRVFECLRVLSIAINAHEII
jgi:phage portal protein BeeE